MFESFPGRTKIKKKHDYLALVLQKVHSELLLMDDENIEIEHDGTCGRGVLPDGGSQEFTLQDPPIVASRGRPKSLRQKHPKENHVRIKRRCSICKQTGHMRTNCPLQRQQRCHI